MITHYMMEKSGKRIYREGLPLFVKTRKESYDTDIDTFFYVNPKGSGEDRPQKIRDIKNIVSIKKMGLKIVSYRLKKKHKITPTQRFMYSIARRDEAGIEIHKLPNGHHLEHDYANNKARLVGRFTGLSGKGRWVRLKKKSISEQKEKMNHQTFWDDLYTENLPEKFQKEQRTKIKIRKGEIAFMISEDNKLICTPLLPDRLVGGAIGMTGTGKTTLIHGTIDRIVHTTNDRVFPMNDEQRENIFYVHPNKDDEVALSNYGNKPIGLPCVFLYQNTEDLEEIDNTNHIIDFKNDLGFKISLSFKHLFNNWKHYMKDIPEWELTAKSGIVFQNLFEKIFKCNSRDGIMRVLDESEELSTKSGEAMKFAIKRVLNNIFNSDILDITSGVPSEWEVTVDNKNWIKMNPILACLYCGLVPVLETHTFNQKVFFPEVIKYNVDIIEKAMLSNPLFKDFRVNFYVDEIINIPEKAMPTIIKIATAGRMKRLGLYWASQFGEKVAKLIYKNTDFLFIFQHAELADMKKIQKSYPEMPKEMINEVMGLEPFELVACTKKYFVAYDLYTGERDIKGKCYKGKILPPLSKHKRPDD